VADSLAVSLLLLALLALLLVLLLALLCHGNTLRSRRAGQRLAFARLCTIAAAARGEIARKEAG